MHLNIISDVFQIITVLKLMLKLYPLCHWEPIHVGSWILLSFVVAKMF